MREGDLALTGDVLATEDNLKVIDEWMNISTTYRTLPPAFDDVYNVFHRLTEEV